MHVQLGTDCGAVWILHHCGLLQQQLSVQRGVGCVMPSITIALGEVGPVTQPDTQVLVGVPSVLEDGTRQDPQGNAVLWMSPPSMARIGRERDAPTTMRLAEKKNGRKEGMQGASVSSPHGPLSTFPIPTSFAGTHEWHSPPSRIACCLQKRERSPGKFHRNDKPASDTTRSATIDDSIRSTASALGHFNTGPHGGHQQRDVRRGLPGTPPMAFHGAEYCKDAIKKNHRGVV